MSTGASSRCERLADRRAELRDLARMLDIPAK